MFRQQFNSLKPKLNPICHLLVLVGAHHVLHVSRIRFKFGSHIPGHRRRKYIFGLESAAILSQPCASYLVQDFISWHQRNGRSTNNLAIFLPVINRLILENMCLQFTINVTWLTRHLYFKAYTACQRIIFSTLQVFEIKCK